MMGCRSINDTSLLVSRHIHLQTPTEPPDPYRIYSISMLAWDTIGMTPLGLVMGEGRSLAELGWNERILESYRVSGL